LNVRQIWRTDRKNSAGCDEATLPAEFIAVCVLAFAASALATVYFCRSCCEMEMPGGWTISMMWTRMPGQTWTASATSFQLMWLTMMVAMMLPSALPTFLKTRRESSSLCYMASGYFGIWLAAGIGIYALGVAVATFAMRSESFSRAIPLLLSASLIGGGLIQFTRWKMTHLLRCRSPLGCASSCPQNETSFRLGCKQGAACCACCAAPMTIQLGLGMMNPLVMILVAIVITAEKLLPRPEITARLVGIAAIVTGATTTIQKLNHYGILPTDIAWFGFQ
jgi:predicted metal-binding membrane protein